MPKREMLINYVPGEECRIAIVEDGKLEELYQERASAESHVGNIYKGKVLNVEPSIQAAFVDFGLERNGFLHISDLHPKYFPGDAREEFERVGQKTPRRERPPIQKCLRRGQEVLVQVLKEGIGTKGPTLTSYLSIPGRFLVMMPHMERLGVSRKVEDDEARREMRKILDELKPPDNFGFIIRTAGIGRTKSDLKRDLAYLQRLWKRIDDRMKSTKVGELYTESDLVIRTIRDVFSTDIERVIVDNPTAAARARDFLAISNPRSASKVFVYHDPVPLFHRFDIERQIENINARTVPLPSGGSLVIDSTEALVAIDVNSGKSRENRDAEMTAYRTNQEAADEICRQLRLRDLGGVVVNDLIDMRNPKHRREIEQRFRNNLKRDRARTRISPISQFGILEMTRQRMRPSLKKSIYTECPHCQASGHVKSSESVVLDVMRRLALAMQSKQAAHIELIVSPDVAFQLLNRKRGSLVQLENEHGKPVLVRVKADGPVDFVELLAFDARGGAVDAQNFKLTAEPELEAAHGTEDPAIDEAEEVEEEDTETPAEELRQSRDRRVEQVDPGKHVDVTEKQLEPALTTELAHQALDIETGDEDASRDAYADSDDDAGPGPSPFDAADSEPAPQTAPGQPGAGGPAAEGQGGRRRRRRRGRRGRGSKDGQPQQGAPQPQPTGGATDEENDGNAAPAPDHEPEEVDGNAVPVTVDGGEQDAAQPSGAPKRRRRRRGGRGRKKNGQAGGAQQNVSNGGADAPANGSDGGHGEQPSPKPRPQPAAEPRSQGYSNPMVNKGSNEA